MTYNLKVFDCIKQIYILTVVEKSIMFYITEIYKKSKKN